MTQSTRSATTVRVTASSCGVPRIVSATLGLSFSAGAKCRIATTMSRSATTPTKMNTIVSTSGQLDARCAVRQRGEQAGEQQPHEHRDHPEDRQPGDRIPLGQVDRREHERPDHRLATGQLIDERRLRRQPGDARLHAVVHAFGGNRRRGGEQPRLRSGEEPALLGAAVREAQPEETADLAVPRADRQTADDRTVVRDGAAEPFGADGALVVGELVRHDSRDRSRVIAGFRRRRRDGRCIGDSH